MLDAADRAAVLPGGTDMASRELIDDRQWQEERLAAMDLVEGLGHLWPRLQELTKVLHAWGLVRYRRGIGSPRLQWRPAAHPNGREWVEGLAEV